MIGAMGLDSPGVVAARRWSRGKRAGFTVLIVVATIGAAALADSIFYLRPIAAEKLWIAALKSGIAPLQEAATFRLRKYPTRDAAIALVSHIRGRVKAGDFGSAARATETLGILAGRSWGSPQPNQWPEVLAQIDPWEERHFGARQ